MYFYQYFVHHHLSYLINAQKKSCSRFRFKCLCFFLCLSFHSAFVNRSESSKMTILDGIIAFLVIILILLLKFAPTSVPLVKGRSIDGLESWQKTAGSSWKLRRNESRAFVSETFIIHFYWSFFRNLFIILQSSVMGEKMLTFLVIYLT